MTGKELFGRILTLGGRTEWNESVNKDHNAVNMALDEVNALFPVTDVARILHYPLRPVGAYPGITVHKGGEDIKINASGIRSLAFAISGTGRANLYKIERDENGDIKSETRLRLHMGESDVEALEWNDLNGFAIVRYLGNTIEDNCEVNLVFSGEYSYMIKDIAFYSEAESELIDDVKPYSYWVEYDINGQKYANNKFADFAAAPVMIDGGEPYALDKYKIEGSRIYLPRDLCAEVEVTYRKRPEAINADNEKDELDIDAELHQLVALKAAYYIYYLIDSEAADRCLAEFNRQLSIVMSHMHKVRTPKKFKDIRGW